LNYSFDYPDEWIEELPLPKIPSNKENYLFKPSLHIFIINILDICPHIRDNGVPIFRDKEKTFKIIRGFEKGDFIPPVNVIDCNSNNHYKYKLTDGCKRLHCSVLVGFTKIPVMYSESYLS
jgi:hypothetical protein